jgi:2-hydroxy-4-(methylsulfanyl)butanoate S-methyltransferase
MNTQSVKQVEEVREISAITYGFMASKALFAALELDVFTQIADGADTLPILARATGIAENRLVTLLTALKSLGLIAESDGHFTNAPATARYLVAGAPGDFRDYVRLVNGAFGYESFRHLGPALRGERIFPDKGFYEGLIYGSGIGGAQFSSRNTRDRLVQRLSWPSGSNSTAGSGCWTSAAAAAPTP